MQCQEGTKGKGLLSAGGLPPKCNDTKISNENICGVQGWPARTWTKESSIEKQHDHFNVENQVLEDNFQIEIPGKEYKHTRVESDEPSKFCGDDTVVVRFVNTAIVERSEAEDACHHGLVEPTINTKEALKAINSMFQEPLEPAVINRRSHRSCPKADKRLDNGFEIFVDASLDTEAGSSSQNRERDFELSQRNSFEANQSLQEPQPLQIYIDDEESNEVGEKINVKGTSEKGKLSAFVFPNPMDLPLDGSINQDSERSPKSRFREDTVVCRFVGTTISDEPQVENVCHHGLVEPTINLKEAMDDINNMFGKPIDFVRANRRKKQDKAPSGKNNCGGFAILPDDDLETPKGHSLPSSSANNESDLFEPTVCMKEAMAEINKMFGMPLDF